MILFICDHPRKPLKKNIPAGPKPLHKSGICGIPHFHNTVPGNITVPQDQFIGSCLMIMLQKLLIVPAPQLFLLFDRLGDIRLHNVDPEDVIR